MGTAIRTRQSVIARDLAHHPNFAVWRALMPSLGFVSAIAVPLKVGEMTYGALTIYATEMDAFDTAEVDLLEELGRILAHGIKELRIGQERTEALAALEQARAELEERVAERTAQLQREVREHIQTEESLRRSEQRYRNWWRMPIASSCAWTPKAGSPSLMNMPRSFSALRRARSWGVTWQAPSFLKPKPAGGTW